MPKRSMNSNNSLGIFERWLFGCWRKQQPLLEEKWRRRSGKRKRKGGKGGKARVGRRSGRCWRGNGWEKIYRSSHIQLCTVASKSGILTSWLKEWVEKWEREKSEKVKDLTRLKKSANFKAWTNVKGFHIQLNWLNMKVYGGFESVEIVMCERVNIMKGKNLNVYRWNFVTEIYEMFKSMTLKPMTLTKTIFLHAWSLHMLNILGSFFTKWI